MSDTASRISSLPRAVTVAPTASSIPAMIMLPTSDNSFLFLLCKTFLPSFMMTQSFRNQLQPPAIAESRLVLRQPETTASSSSPRKPAGQKRSRRLTSQSLVLASLLWSLALVCVVEAQPDPCSKTHPFVGFRGTFTPDLGTIQILDDCSFSHETRAGFNNVSIRGLRWGGQIQDSQGNVQRIGVVSSSVVSGSDLPVPYRLLPGLGWSSMDFLTIQSIAGEIVAAVPLSAPVVTTASRTRTSTTTSTTTSRPRSTSTPTRNSTAIAKTTTVRKITTTSTTTRTSSTNANTTRPSSTSSIPRSSTTTRPATTTGTRSTTTTRPATTTGTRSTTTTISTTTMTSASSTTNTVIITDVPSTTIIGVPVIIDVPITITTAPVTTDAQYSATDVPSSTTYSIVTSMVTPTNSGNVTVSPVTTTIPLNGTALPLKTPVPTITDPASPLVVRLGPNPNYPGLTPTVLNVSLWINDIESPVLVMTRGKRYTFSIQAGTPHPVYITTSREGGKKAFPNSTEIVVAGNITTFGTPSNPLLLDFVAPLRGEITGLNDSTALFYQCYIHPRMGWKIIFQDDNTTASADTSGSSVVPGGVGHLALVVLVIATAALLL